MRFRLIPVFALLSALIPNGAAGAGNPAETSAPVRNFELVYRVTVAPAPEAVLKLWIPVAATDANQHVALKAVSSPVPTHMERETAYGDHILYAEIKNAKAPVTLSLTYEVTRKLYSRGSFEQLRRHDRDSDPPLPDEMARFLQPDRLIPINARFRKLAAEITRGQTGEVGKAYAIYNYVFHNLRYDKSGAGWGRGDAMWACDSKHGNCTDFHSLFIALMRAENIAARFEIGFPLPADKRQGDISGYHCWAEFYLSGLGWVPVDISEAWQDPSRHDFLFGSLDANRVQFAIGRDLTLSPPQAGPPLNYFIYPYAELNGQPYDGVKGHFSFRDLPASGAAAGR